MKVLHVITSLDTGGAERLMVDLLPLLKDRGHEMGLLLFNGADAPLKEEWAATGIPLFELTHPGDIEDKWATYGPWNIVRLMKYVKKYDIVHTHNTACQFYTPIAKLLSHANAKLVTTEHNTTNRRRSMGWYKPIDRWMYNRYDAIICIADQTSKNLEQHIGHNSAICTIYNGVNINKFIKPVKNIDRQERFAISMVAGFRPQKDHATLIKALSRLPDKFSLQLVGRGETEQEMKNLCSDLGLDQRVSFMGMRSDVSDILDRSDVIVLSSHWEGLSLSSIEGMASGRPFVASDVEGLRDVVAGAGVLFPQGDDEALARAIQELCENPARYKEVALACQEHAKRYDISLMADGYDKLYRSLFK